MYFPVGWPKVLWVPEIGHCSIRRIICNRDKILFAVLTEDSLYIWFCKPCVPVVFHRRSAESVTQFGSNELVEWKPDSHMLVVATLSGFLLFYKLTAIEDHKELYAQVDSPHPNLRRDSSELFIKESVPRLSLNLENTMHAGATITSLVCIRDELMLATTGSHVLRYRWDGSVNRDYCLDLRRVPFCTDQQVSKAIPITEANVHIVDIEYSPLVGGFAIVLSDGRAAFLTASSLKFDPNQVQGIWAQNIDDATCASVNHKYRFIAFGRRNSQGVVYVIDESTGGLQVSHHCVLSSKDFPGLPGAVRDLRWTPDSSAMAMAWTRGGLALWSTFGALLMCTLAWDYGLLDTNPLCIHNMEWSAEGYQLWMVKHHHSNKDEGCNGTTSPNDSIIQLDFVKSALTVNPCMSHLSHLYLQGEDRLYLNMGENLMKVYQELPRDQLYNMEGMLLDSSNHTMTRTLMGSKPWIVVPIPSSYAGTNWPIRYTCIDTEGQNLALAGRTGLAHYSLVTRKWKLFGNETQEKDFVVTGGLMWWNDFILLGCYNIPDTRDEVRLYPRDFRLDNAFMKRFRVSSQVLLLNILKNKLITFCANGQLTIFNLSLEENQTMTNVEVSRLQSVDISALCVHPACVVSVALTALRTEAGRKDIESILLNISGRLLLVQRHSCAENSDEDEDTCETYTCSPPTVLASCVENVWVPRKSRREKPHLTESLWLFCGAHGMRVWLPLFPRDGDKSHSFMSKRIMLPFQLRIYPLAILFEDAIILGAENDTILYTSDSSSPFSLPFSVLERTSQVYLHQILRQLIRRNLGYHAWEIARSCTGLPYFPHSLELLLHEVLEEEATSKEPIPDALLPSVIEFIQEFPVYLQTVVQCARKTEIALWPYLFSAAGKPKELFLECLSKKQLDTAASYLIILQNLEPSTTSRQYATLLLDAALQQGKWELSKDLVRFLRAIDPNDVESPRASFILSSKYAVSPQTPPLSPNEEDLSLVLGTMQMSRGRSFSTTTTPKVQQIDTTTSIVGHHRDVIRTTSGNEPSKPIPVRRKKSVPTGRGDTREASSSADDFFIDVILQRHARKLLSSYRLLDLGFFASFLDFHLVTWLVREKERAAHVGDFISALKQVHSDFQWPYPVLQHPVSHYLHQGSSTDSSPTSPNATDVSRLSLLDGSNSRVGDSGYTSYISFVRGHKDLSHPMNSHGFPTGSYDATDFTSLTMGNEFPNAPIMEAQLVPHLLQDATSILSEESSMWEDDREFCNSYDVSSDVSSNFIYEQLSAKVPTRGTPKAEVKLRYLLHLFMEASCLEWALIISTVLRDMMAILRITQAIRSPDCVPESIMRLKSAMVTFHQWSNAECLGYKPFMLAMQSQLGILNRVLNVKQQQQQPPQQTGNFSTCSLTSRQSGNSSEGTCSTTDETGTCEPSVRELSALTIDEINTKSSGADDKSSRETTRAHTPIETTKEQGTENSSSCTIS